MIDEVLEIKSLIDDGSIERIPGVREHGSEYLKYSIKGYDADKIRLFVWVKDHNVAWILAGRDERNIWFNVGDREDLMCGYEFKDISWRSHSKFSTPSEWVRSLIK